LKRRSSMAPARLGPRRLLIPGRDMPWRTFLRRLLEELAHDDVDDVAASVTFYCIVALFPALLFTVGLVSQVVSWETIQTTVLQISRVAPREVTAIVQQRLVALKEHPSGGVLTVGFVGMLWSASAGVSALIPALDRAYDVVETRPFWMRRLLAIGVTLAGGGAVLVASLIALALPAVASRIGGPLGVALNWARLPTAGAMMMTVWAALYSYLPNVRPRFQPVTPGSVVGVVLWVCASWAFGQYAERFGDYEAIYGALGGAIVLLIWMWVSAMALLLGAEINKILMPPADKKITPTHVANLPIDDPEYEPDAALNAKVRSAGTRRRSRRRASATRR